MALETPTSSETLSTTQFSCNDDVSSENKILFGNNNNNVPKHESQQQAIHEALNSSCRKKRRRMCNNKEEVENLRMTHIAIERNRRKLMNEYVDVLRSLLPKSYDQKVDQVSIVGRAIDFVKRLEHTLQFLESRKSQLPKQGIITTTTAADVTSNVTTTTLATTTATTSNSISTSPETSPFAQFFSYPQYTSPQYRRKLFNSKSKGSTADIEVTLIETHANVRILSQRRVRQLSKLVAAFQTLYLTILHLNVTTFDPLVLYSISVKVEEDCQFGSANGIASVINHILRKIEEETTLCC